MFGLASFRKDGQLQEVFSHHGTVESAHVILDKFTGRSRGFGFVEMSSGIEEFGFELARGGLIGGGFFYTDAKTTTEGVARIHSRALGLYTLCRTLVAVI